MSCGTIATHYGPANPFSCCCLNFGCVPPTGSDYKQVPLTLDFHLSLQGSCPSGGRHNITGTLTYQPPITDCSTAGQDCTALPRCAFASYTWTIDPADVPECGEYVSGVAFYCDRVPYRPTAPDTYPVWGGAECPHQVRDTCVWWAFVQLLRTDVIKRMVAIPCIAEDDFTTCFDQVQDCGTCEFHNGDGHTDGSARVICCPEHCPSCWCIGNCDPPCDTCEGTELCCGSCESAGIVRASAYASGVGAAVATGTGTAAGGSTANGYVSGSVVGAGSAPGDSTGTGIGAATSGGTGSAPGDSTGTGVGASTNTGAGSAPGDSTGSGIGASTNTGTGSAPGDSTGTGVGAATSGGTGSAPGDSTGTGVGATLTGWCWSGSHFVMSDFAGGTQSYDIPGVTLVDIGSNYWAADTYVVLDLGSGPTSYTVHVLFNNSDTHLTINCPDLDSISCQSVFLSNALSDYTLSLGYHYGSVGPSPDGCAWTFGESEVIHC